MAMPLNVRSPQPPLSPCKYKFATSVLNVVLIILRARASYFFGVQSSWQKTPDRFGRHQYDLGHFAAFAHGLNRHGAIEQEAAVLREHGGYLLGRLGKVATVDNQIRQRPCVHGGASSIAATASRAARPCLC